MKILEYNLLFDSTPVDLSFIGYSLNRISKFKAVLDSMSSVVNNFLDIKFPVNIFKHDDENRSEISRVELFVKSQNIFVLFYDEEYYLNSHDIIDSRTTLLKLHVFAKDKYSIDDDIQLFHEGVLSSFASYYAMLEDEGHHVYGNVENAVWIQTKTNVVDYLKVKRPLKFPKFKFQKCSIPSKDYFYSDLLSNDVVRSILLNIKKSKRNSVKYVAKDFEKIRDIAVSIILNEGYTESYKLEDLFLRKFVIKCRKRNIQLIELDLDYKVSIGNLKNMKCPHCGRNYEDEIIEEVAETTEYLDYLMNKGYWMAVQSVKYLKDIGVNEDQIIFELEHKSEEIDILCIISGMVILVELKDSDFDLGHAYPIPYRESLFGADGTLIICTGNISKEVKEHFDHIADEKNSTRDIFSIGNHNFKRPFYIEGIDKFEWELNKLDKRCQEIMLFNTVEDVRRISKINFKQLLSTHFRLN